MRSGGFADRELKVELRELEQVIEHVAKLDGLLSCDALRQPKPGGRAAESATGLETIPRAPKGRPRGAARLVDPVGRERRPWHGCKPGRRQ